MAESVFDRIELIRQHATRQEKVIIDFVLKNNKTNLIFLSITEFSEQSNVAEATVLRFCRKLGLRGYSEFRMLLAQSAGNEKESSEGDYAHKILVNMTSALESTYELIDSEQIDKAAELILGAKNIFAYGSGNSGVAAEEFRNKLMRYGVHVNHITDNHFQMIVTSTLKQDDTLVLFSVSGGTKDMINVAAEAKKLGVKMVIITNYLKSPLAGYSDALLYVVAKSLPLDSGSLVAKVSQLFVINVLSNAIYLKLGGNAEDNLQKTAISVLDKEV